MAIGAMVKSALEIDEETKIQFHVHREEKHKHGAGSQKIFIWTFFSFKSIDLSLMKYTQMIFLIEFFRLSGQTRL